MTTVACSLTEMAADSKVMDESVGTGVIYTHKVFAIGDSLFGIAGNLTEALLVIDWLRAGRNKFERPHIPDNADFSLLELAAQGISIWTPDLAPVLIQDTCCAIGSGGPVAHYCMSVLGMRPYQAVVEAAKVDNNTGPPVCVMYLNETQPRKKTNGRTRTKPKARR